MERDQASQFTHGLLLLMLCKKTIRPIFAFARQ